MRTFLERCSDPSRFAVAAPGFGSPHAWTERRVGDRTIRQFRLDRSGRLTRYSRRVGSTVAVTHRRRSLSGFATVYSHSPELLLPFVLSGFRGRLVLHVLGDLPAEARHARNPLFRPFGRPYRQLAFWVMRHCDRVLWIDATQIPLLPREIADRSEPLATFYDPELFRPAERPQPAPSRPLLVSVSRLTPLKRVDVIVRALARAAAAGDDWGLAICGSGPEERDLRRLADDLGVGDRIEWHVGHLSGAELAELLRSADAGLLVSAAEGSPAAVKEMLASGLPVVVSDVGDNRTLVHDGVNGVLLARVDADAVHEGVRRALALAPSARDAAVASVAPFTVERWVERLESLLTR